MILEKKNQQQLFLWKKEIVQSSIDQKSIQKRQRGKENNDELPPLLLTLTAELDVSECTIHPLRIYSNLNSYCP